MFLKDLLAGGISSVITETIVAPIERVKLLLQVQNASVNIPEHKRYKGILDCLRRVPKEQGILSLWRGNTVECLRIFPVHALNFALKDYLRVIFVKGVSPVTDFWWFTLGNFAAGGISGICATTLLYPLEFARTRLAADVGKKKNREFTGTVDCLRKTLKTDGIKGIFRGYGPSLLGIATYRALYFGIYDVTKDDFKELTHEDINIYLRLITAEVSTAVAGLCSYPFDTVRRRMMMQSGLAQDNIRYKTSIECCKKIYLEEGHRGFFSGGLANLFKGAGLAFVLIFYDELKKVFD